jgi:hypothetical protein
MKNLGEHITVGSGFTEEDGTKLEPELQPVKHTIDTSAEVNTGVGPDGGQQVGSLPVAITTEMPAIEAADALISLCHDCIFWRPDEWPAIREKLSLEEKGALRATLLSKTASEIPQLDDGNDDYHSIDHALANGTHGVCKALSDMAGDNVITFYTATCPDTAPNGQPLPLLFKPKSEARRAVMRARDAILITASGRKPA